MSRLRLGRRAARVLAVAALTLGATVTAMSTASAVPSGTDCLHPPDPASPSSGVSAWIDPGPEKPLDGDPFAKDPKVSIYDVYGYAGTKIVRYDDGCASTFNLWNDLANFNQGVSSVSIAVTTRVYRTVISPAFGSIFQPMQEAAQHVLGNGLFLPFAAIPLAATGVYFATRTKEGNFKGTVNNAGHTVRIFAIGLACTIFPLTFGAWVDQGIGQVVSTVSTLATGDNAGKAPADMVAGAAVQSVTYSTWAQSTFGTGPLNEKVAREYGPRLFKAAAYTRAEQAKIDADPSKAQAMGDLKREEYKKVAKEIEDKYPDVYQWVAGNHQQEQFGYSIAGVLGAIISVAFLVYSLFRMAYAMIVVRLAIGAGPAVALVGMYPSMHHIVSSVTTVVVEAIRSALFFGASAVLFTVVAIGTILSPSSSLHPVVKIFAVLALTYALMRAQKQLGIEALRQKLKWEDRQRRSDEEADARTQQDSGDPFKPSTDGGQNTSQPVDIGYVQASRRAPAQPVALPAAQTPSRVAAIGATAARGAAGAAARGGFTGAAKGLAKGVALTAGTAGTGAGALVGSTVKGAVGGSVKGAARGAAVAAVGSGVNPPPAAKSGTVIYHPSAGSKRPPVGAGPSGRAVTGKVVGGARVYNIYKPKAGAK